MLHNTQQLSSGMFRTANLLGFADHEKIRPMEKGLIKNNIRQLRLRLGLSQEEFGKPFNASRMDVSRYEKGLHLTVRLLLDIHKAYGVSIDSLLLADEAAEDGRNKINKDLMLKSTMALLSAAQILGVRLTREEEEQYACMVYNHSIEFNATPDIPLAAALLKQKVA
jgi:transcriptional regulator with XRE-family HTH domain